MATTDFNLEQYIDNKALDEIERETWKHDREQEAKQLHLDLEMPLPDEPKGRKKALSDRVEIFDNLRVLNNKLSPQPTPAIVQWEDIPDIERREWLIDQWLPANTVTMFTGDGGAGKSWLTLQAVCQVCCGFRDAYLDPDFKKVADFTARREVVFATYEDEPAEIKRRLQALAKGMPWIEDSLTTIYLHLHIVDMRGIGSVWGPGMGKHIQNTGDLLAAGEDLRAICKEKKARLLVIDPLSGAFGGNENDRTAVYDFVSSFRGWGDAAKCAMLVIGHLPKSKEGKEAGFSGSTAWEASARSMWMLSKKVTAKKKSKDDEALEVEGQHYWTLEHTKSNYAPIQQPVYLAKHKQGWWSQAADREEAAEAFETYQQGREHTTQEDRGDDSCWECH